MTAELVLRAERGIRELEAFLESWIRGHIDGSEEVLKRLSDALAPDFLIVPPPHPVLDREGLIEYMRAQHGADPGIERSVDIRDLREIGEGLVRALFDEIQTRDGQDVRNRISAVLRERPGTAEGMEWVHVHETRLSATGERAARTDTR